MEDKKYSKHVVLMNNTVMSQDDSQIAGEHNDQDQSHVTKDLNQTKGDQTLYNESQFPTEKKNFKSEINPHFLKRTDQRKHYVWYGTYQDHLKSGDMPEALESAAIHLKDYELIFMQNGETVQPVLVKDPNESVCLVKIYLVKKERFESVVKDKTQGTFEVCEETLKENQIYDIKDSSGTYDAIVNVGELDQLPIYFLTNTSAFKSPEKASKTQPSEETLSEMFSGLKETFTCYSEQFILYYLFSKDCKSTVDPKNHRSLKSLMYIIKGAEGLENACFCDQDMVDDTVKCSTCVDGESQVDDTVQEESKLVTEESQDEPKVVEEEVKQASSDSSQLKTSMNNVLIRQKTSEDDWNLFDLPQFSEESADKSQN